MGPPPLQTGTVIDQTYRFRGTSANAISITIAQVLAACGMMAPATGGAGTVNLLPFALSMRVKRIRMWSAQNFNGSTTASSSNFASVSVDYDVDASNGGNPGLQFTDTTMSPAKLAFVDSVPPSGSFASFWHSQVEASEVLFILASTQSSIVDVHVEWVLNDDDGIAGLAGIGNIGAVTAGHVYYRGLGASQQYVPIGRVTA